MFVSDQRAGDARGMQEDIVFVCTGNICRSPMAEYLFRTNWEQALGMRGCSAGVMANYGIPASRFAVKAMDEIGIDLTPHRSQPVTPHMVATAKLFVVMTRGHEAHLKTMCPEAAERVHLLRSFVSESRDMDIMDPIGLSLDVYRYVRDEIAEGVRALAAYLQQADRSGTAG